ncbi:MAG: T9SS type A sorting domain-containing protein [Bacteroidota bacterium]
MRNTFSLLTLLCFFCPFGILAQEAIWGFSTGGHVDDFIYDVEADRHGNSYITGSTKLDIPFGSYSTNSHEFYLAKLDSNGNVLWLVTGDGNGSAGTEIAIGSAGNVYVMGRHSGMNINGVQLTGGLNSRVFVVKIAADGTFLWAKDFGSISSTGTTAGAGMDIDQYGNVYVAGTFRFPILFNNTTLTPNGINEDIFIYKLSPNGLPLWVRTYGGIYDDGATGLTVVNNKVYIVGSFINNNAIFDTISVNLPNVNRAQFLAQVSVDGSIERLDVYPTDANNFMSFTNIIHDKLGKLYINGRIVGSHNFSPQWSVSNLVDEIFVSKFDSAGNILWLDHFGTNLPSYWGGGPSAISVDSVGNVYTSMSFSDTVSIPPLEVYSANYGRGFFIVKWSDVGYPQWIKETGGGKASIKMRQTSCGPSNDFFVSGSYDYGDTLLLDTIVLINNSGNNDADLFAAKFRDTTILSCPPDTARIIPSALTICEGDSISIHALYPYLQTIQWYANGQKILGADAFELFISDTGFYYAEINDYSSCSTFSDTLYVANIGSPNVADVYLRPKPESHIAGDSVFCAFSDSIFFSAISPSAASYNWQVVGGNPLTSIDSAGLYIQWQGGSSGLLVLTVNDSMGCTQDDSLQIVINALPIPSISLQNGSCLEIGDTIILSTSFESNVSYAWQGLGGTFLSQVDQISTSFVLVDSSAEIILTKIDTITSCIAEEMLSLEVGRYPDPQLLGDTTACEQSPTLYVLNMPAFTSSFQWEIVGGNALSSSTNSFIQVNWEQGLGTIIISETNQDGCVASDSLTINVWPAPQVSVVRTGNTVQAFPSGLIYQWTRNGWPVPDSLGGMQDIINIDSTGYYQVTVTDLNGCSQVSDTVSLQLISSLDKESKVDWKLYPNPAGDFLEVQLPHLNTEGIIEVWNLQGQRLIRKKIRVGDNQIHLILNSLPRASYVCVLITPEGMYQKRFIRK